MQIQQTEYFPKLHAPFEREEDDHGNYLVTPDVRDEYAWVFDDAERVKAVEKLDGENVGVQLDENLDPVAIYRRDGIADDPTDGERVYQMAEVPLWETQQGPYETAAYTEGVMNAYNKRWIQRFIDDSGLYWGELVGPKVQGNRYDLDKHYWVPFEYARNNLVMESYGQYGVAYDDLSGWFEDGLIPIFYSKMHGGLDYATAADRVDVEGVVFTHPDPDTADSHPYAKLRRDMFPWFYE